MKKKYNQTLLLHHAKVNRTEFFVTDLWDYQSVLILHILSRYPIAYFHNDSRMFMTDSSVHGFTARLTPQGLGRVILGGHYAY